ncbi:MAG: preprotein translocase subunit YajC [Clostridiales bacterium]|nr:preprotein translocase subunit YajC [Clostridiales bacterium]
MSSTYGSLIYLVGLFAIFYFLILRPQQKKTKQLKEMRASIKAGDKVTTIGGMVGTILKINGEDITLEVGADKLRMNFKVWAIGTVDPKVNEIEG